jgi:hypothetical protein
LHRYAAEIDNQRVAVAHAVATGRHDDAYQIIADSGSGASGRPSFEILDWIDPIGHTGQRTRWPVTRWRLTERSLAGDAAAIETLLDDAEPLDSEFDRLTRETMALFVPLIRAFEDGVLGQQTLVTARAEAHELVGRSRATGDPLALTLALVLQAFLLANDGSPDEVFPIALEADAIAREHGIGLMVDVASNAFSVVLGRLAHTDTDRDRAAHELRRRLAEVKKRHNHVLGVAMLGGIALLLAPVDVATAHILEAVRARFQPGYTGLLPDPATVLDPDTVARIRSQADQLDVADAIELALEALDQLIDDDDRQRSDGGRSRHWHR